MSLKQKLVVASEAMRFGELNVAEEILSEAIIEAGRYGEDSMVLGAVHEHMAKLAALKGNYQDAIKNLRSVLQIKRANFGLNHVQTIKTLSQLSEVYMHLNDFDRAEQTLRKLLCAQIELFGELSLETGKTAHHLGLLFQANAKWHRAEEYYKLALRAKISRLGSKHGEVLVILTDYAGLLRQLERSQEAEHLLACAGLD